MKKPFIVTKVFTLSEIAKMSGEKEFAAGMPLRSIRMELMDCFLPEIGFWMADRGVDEIRKEELLNLIANHQKEPVPECRWTVYTREKNRSAMPFIQKMNAEEILEELEKHMKLLTMVEEDVYEFTNPDHLQYFAGLGMNYRLIQAVKLFEEMKAENDESKKKELAAQIVDDLNFFEQKPWEKEILTNCGCQFEIPRTCPKVCNDEWIQKYEWIPEFHTVMDFFRRVPENPVMEKLLENRSHGHRKAKYYSEQNLGTMLRFCRINGSVVDFTGIDFHGIDMSKMDLSETIFGRKRDGKPWYANLEHTGFESAWC